MEGWIWRRGCIGLSIECWFDDVDDTLRYGVMPAAIAADDDSNLCMRQ